MVGHLKREEDSDCRKDLFDTLIAEQNRYLYHTLFGDKCKVNQGIRANKKPDAFCGRPENDPTVV
jgi:hypothetical protein